MVNLNDPYCQQFIEAVASILVHLQQEEHASEAEQEELHDLPVQSWQIMERVDG